MRQKFVNFLFFLWNSANFSSKSENFWKNILIHILRLIFWVKFCQRKIKFIVPRSSLPKLWVALIKYKQGLLLNSHVHWPISISLNLPYLSCSLLGLLGPPWLTLWSNKKKELSGFTILKCHNLQTWRILYLTFPWAFSCRIMGEEVFRLKVVRCTHYL
jgi:hypothetical protein